MSVPSATTLQFGHQLATIVNRTAAPAEKPLASSTGTSRQVKDSVSLSANVQSAYKAQAADNAKQQAPESSKRASAVTPSEIRDLSTQMRRLSSEATQIRNADQAQASADTSSQDGSIAAPLSDTLTADERPQASFQPLNDAARAINPDSHDSGGGDPQPRQDAEPRESNSAETSTAVDSQASLVNLDHALGKIAHGRSHGSDFEALSQATRLSVKQRESLAVAHSEGGSHEVASATAQTGRVSRSAKQASTMLSQAPSATRESRTYTRPARKA